MTFILRGRAQRGDRLRMTSWGFPRDRGAVRAAALGLDNALRAAVRSGVELQEAAALAAVRGHGEAAPLLEVETGPEALLRRALDPLRRPGCIPLVQQVPRGHGAPALRAHHRRHRLTSASARAG